MSQRVDITYYGMEGEGRNVTEAKKDAGARLERLVKDVDQGTWIGMIRSHPCVIWRNRHGWTYEILFPDSDTTFQKRYGRGTYETRSECEAHMRYHMAQLHCLNDDWQEWLGELTTEDHRRDFQRYRTWQLDYKRLRAEGYSDTEAHRMACGF